MPEAAGEYRDCTRGHSREWTSGDDACPRRAMVQGNYSLTRGGERCRSLLYPANHVGSLGATNVACPETPADARDRDRRRARSRGASPSTPVRPAPVHSPLALRRFLPSRRTQMRRSIPRIKLATTAPGGRAFSSVGASSTAELRTRTRLGQGVGTTRTTKRSFFGIGEILGVITNVSIRSHHSRGLAGPGKSSRRRAATPTSLSWPPRPTSQADSGWGHLSTITLLDLSTTMHTITVSLGSR